MLAPLAAAGASLVGQAIGAFSANKMNKRAEKFARESQARQRQEALSDWNMQNAYNDPAAQMKRLENAGLNANLVYGNGAAAQTAQSAPRGSDTSQPSYETPKMDLGSVTMQAMAAQQMQANIAKTHAETERVEADTKAMLYQNQMLTPELFSSEYQFRKDKALYSGSVLESEATIKKLEAETAALISGYSIGHNVHTKADTKRQNPNLTVSKMLADIQSVVANKQGREIENALRGYEKKIIDSIGVSGTHAEKIVQNIFKLFLLKTR